MNATSAMFAALALVACTDDAGTPASSGSTDGTYDVTRTVTQWEPSPDFAIPNAIAMTLANGEVSFATTGVIAYGATLDHAHLTFTSSEDWPSPDGHGAANLAYDVQLGDGTLTGTIAAHVVFDQPPVYGDFDFTLAITGTKRP